jgi:uncharacterized protein YodC (DUF2158 family)
MAKFKEGDTVRLRSGGPLMTVKTLHADGTLWCEWFDKNKLEGAEFKPASLEADDGGPELHPVLLTPA